MLTDRRAQLLRLIVREYIETAVPVASEAITYRYGLNVSPATVRNEMARLEAEGYIIQPHTSAGRIPSDKGYRYYIESLMVPEDLPEEEKRTIRHQFHQSARDVEEWLQLAAAVLAGAVHNLAVAIVPPVAAARVRHVHLVAVQDLVALLIVLLQTGKLSQQLLTLKEPATQEELDLIANKFNSLFNSRTVQEYRLLPVAEMSPLEETIAGEIVEIMREEEATGYGHAYLDGLRLVLSQPEFAQASKILEVLETVDEHNLPRFIPFQNVEPQQVNIIVGSENPQEVLRDWSVVVARYGSNAYLSGGLAVLGPTRMHYDRAVTTVRYITSVMDELLAAYYGTN